MLLAHQNFMGRHQSCNDDSVHCFLTTGCFRQSGPLRKAPRVHNCKSDILHVDTIKTEVQLLGLHKT